MPAAVPSLFQSAAPFTPSSAMKNNALPTPASSAGSVSIELALPEAMSTTIAVPAAVPSLFQSSRPCTPSFAAKNSVPFTFVRSYCESRPVPVAICFTGTVPAVVPSLFQSETPGASFTVKNSVPFTLTGTLFARRQRLHEHGSRLGAVGLPQAVPIGQASAMKNSAAPIGTSATGMPDR